MAALPPKADICSAPAHVRFTPKADIASKLVRAAKTMPRDVSATSGPQRSWHSGRPEWPRQGQTRADANGHSRANDDHVGTQVCRGRQDRVFNVLIVGHDTLNASIASLNSGLQAMVENAGDCVVPTC